MFDIFPFGFGGSVDSAWTYAIGNDNRLYAGKEDAGGPASAIAASLFPSPPIVADGSAVYWIDHRETTWATARIMKLSRP